MWYNCDEEDFEYKYLAMLAIDNEEDLIKYCEGDKIMEDFKESVIDINNNDIYKDILSKEEDNMMVIKAGLDYAKQEGLAEGIEKGIEKGEAKRNIEIARNMLEKDIDIKIISEVTGLSIKEIENLK